MPPGLLISSHCLGPPGASQGSWTVASKPDAAISTLPELFAKGGLQEHTQLALCPRERQSKAAGDVPPPIKINGTKAPWVLHEFHLLDPFPFPILPPSPVLSFPLPWMSLAQVPSSEGRVPKGNQTRVHTHRESHTCTHSHTQLHCKYTHTHTCACTNTCTHMHLFSSSF